MNRPTRTTVNEPPPGRPPTGFGHYLRDIVYGAADGVITTIAVIAGATGASFEPRVALVLGLANLAADGLSMGASNYLGLKSELEQIGSSVAIEKPWLHGLATSVAFVGAGSLPLLSYFVPRIGTTQRFQIAVFLALVSLAAIGALRSRFLNKAAWICALEMVVIAGGAGGVAYVLGALVEPLLR